MSATLEQPKKRKAPKQPERITQYDRWRVIELVQQQFAALESLVNEKAADRNAAVDATRKLLHDNSFPGPWHFAAQGEPAIDAKKDGLHVRVDGRVGIVRYVELVDAARDTGEQAAEGQGSGGGDQGSEAYAYAPRDSRINEHGVFTRGYECVEIPLPKTSKCSAEVLVVESQGEWIGAMRFDGILDVTGSYSSLPNVVDTRSETRVAAIRRACEGLRPRLDQHKSDARIKKALVALDEFLATLGDSSTPAEPSKSARNVVVASADPAGDGPRLNKNGMLVSGKLDPGRFGTRSSALPDGIAAVDRNTLGWAEIAKDVEGAALKELPVDGILPNPYQPRREFGEAELAELAASIERNGLIQPIVVRPAQGAAKPFQILAGERRWRAMQKLGKKTIAAFVRHVDDRAMQAGSIDENDQRTGLNPLERALAMQRILDEQHKQPKDLETILGMSQGAVSSHLRLLKLPAIWQTRVAKGDLSLTHARHLMPYAHIEPAMKVLVKWLDHDKWRVGSHEQFGDMVQRAVASVSKSIDDGRWSVKHNDHLPAMKLTDEQIAELNIVELPPPQWNKKAGPDRRAVNVKLFEKLWAAHEQAWKPKRKGATKQADKDLSPAEVKAAKARQRRERAEQFAKRLRAWRANWMRWLISKRLAVRGVKADDQTMMRVLLWCAGRHGFMDGVLQSHDRSRLIETIGVEGVEGTKGGKGRRGHDLWSVLLSAEDPFDVADKFTQRLFWDKIDGVAQPIRGLPDDEVLQLAEQLKLDLAAAWKDEKAGPLTEAFYNLFDKEQLLERHRQVTDINYPFFKGKKSILVADIVAAKTPAALKLPDELQGVRKKGKKPR